VVKGSNADSAPQLPAAPHLGPSHYLGVLVTHKRWHDDSVIKKTIQRWRDNNLLDAEEVAFLETHLASLPSVPLYERVDALRTLHAAASGPVWMDGTAGDCNLVSWDGADVVGVGIVHSAANREFIIEAHRSIPEILTEVETLRAALLKIRAQLGRIAMCQVIDPEAWKMVYQSYCDAVEAVAAEAR
jgi:hypothetical protein